MTIFKEVWFRFYTVYSVTYFQLKATLLLPYKTHVDRWQYVMLLEVSLLSKWLWSYNSTSRLNTKTQRTLLKSLRISGSQASATVVPLNVVFCFSEARLDHQARTQTQLPIPNGILLCYMLHTKDSRARIFAAYNLEEGSPTGSISSSLPAYRKSSSSKGQKKCK